MSRVLHTLPMEVDVHENIFIALSDGTRLAARLWLPIQKPECNDTKFPALLEYIPYRKRDGTRTRDEPMHGFFSGHGYACVRVDIRGSGDSDGVLLDEYLKKEQDDALEVIDWISRQPWCTGGVGMFGKSWGGLNSLQIAARRPPALRAIIVVGFSDNRYQDDIHWKGGCLLSDNFWWGSIMQAFLSQPPDPVNVGEAKWKDMWLQRLHELPMNAADWLSNPCYNDYWKHGSVCENYDAIQVPVLAVDGWADAYTNCVFRLMEKLKVTRRGIVGPWAHLYPQDGCPAPPMNFLREAVEWWDHWLRGKHTNAAMRKPMLQVYVEDSIPPCSCKPLAPGRWLALKSWPSPSVQDLPWTLSDGRLLFCKDGAVEARPAEDVVVKTLLCHGLLSGEWMGVGVSGETAADQRMDNGMSVTFTSAPQESSLNLLGRPTFSVTLSSDQPKGFLFVQLCDVAPDGAATRISYGMKNLVHLGPQGEAGVAFLGDGESTEVNVELEYCGYRVPKKHRLCLSLANSFWPMVWPSPRHGALTVQLSTAVLRLPHLQVLPTDDVSTEELSTLDGVVIPGPDVVPEVAAPTPATLMRSGHMSRSLHYDIVQDKWTCTTDCVGGVFGQGVYRFDDIDTTVEHNQRRELELSNKDPLSAKYTMVQKMKTSRPGWNTDVDIETSQTGDDAFMHLRTHVVAKVEGETVFEKNWYRRIPRCTI